MKLIFDKPVIIAKGNKITCELPFNFINNNKSYIKGVAVGIARCNNEDRFDYNKGIKIAITRAESEAYDKVIKKFKPLFQMFENEVNSFNDFKKKGNDCIEHNIKYLEELTK